MDIAGRVALVTGGAHRVGKAIAMMLAVCGADVAVTYHTSSAAASQTLTEVESLGVRAAAVRCDLTKWDDVQTMAAAVRATLGAVDILVNSAGLFRRTPFPTQDIDLWHKVTRTSVDGAFYVCNCFVPSMMQQGEGVIVNILDLAAFHPWPHYAAHSVAKAGLLAFTRQLAIELSPTIRTNAVAAGPVLPPDGLSESRRSDIASRTLLGRWGVPGDVADAVRYLIEADYVVGEVITVDGGERYGYTRSH